MVAKLCDDDTRPNEGALQLILCVILVMVVTSSFGIWSILRHWRFLVTTQLRLDRCVGQVAQDFRNSLNSVADQNKKIETLRHSIVLAEFEPWLIPPLKAALSIVVARQEWAIQRWRLKQLQWISLRGCNHAGDQVTPLPSMEYLRAPPDTVGPNLVEWNGNMPLEFRFQLRHSSRYSAAKVRRNSNEYWIAIWSLPKRPSFY